MSAARPETGGAAAPESDGALSDRALILLLGACNALGPVSSLLPDGVTAYFLVWM